jgi:hypothetical protein
LGRGGRALGYSGNTSEGGTTMKKALLLSVLALTTSALALAAPASASEWTLGGEPLSEDIELTFEGSVAFQTAVNGIACPLGFNLNAPTDPKKTTVKNFYIDAFNCKFTGTFKGCFITKQVSKNDPWDVDLEPKDYTVTNLSIEYTLNNGCAGGKTFPLTIKKYTVEPADPSKITNTSVSGTGESPFGTVTIPSTFESETSNEMAEIGEFEGGLGIEE